jgi:hypothetical protein
LSPGETGPVERVAIAALKGGGREGGREGEGEKEEFLVFTSHLVARRDGPP